MAQMRETTFLKLPSTQGLGPSQDLEFSPKGPRTQIMGFQGQIWYLGPKALLFGSLDP